MNFGHWHGAASRDARRAFQSFRVNRRRLRRRARGDAGIEETMVRNTNAGTMREPYLRCDINTGTWTALPATSRGPRGTDEEIHGAVKAAGFQGVQGADPALCRRLGLGITGG